MIKLTTVHGIYRSYWSITNHSQYASVCPDSDDLSSSLSDCSTKVNNPSRESVCLPEVNDPSWLSGRGFFCGYVGDPVLLVNEKEHLKFIIQQKGYNIVNLFTRLYNFIYKVEDLLKENGKEFALHETYGYLTSSPRETGSGLRISVILKLPLLMQVGYLASYLQYVGNNMRKSEKRRCPPPLLEVSDLRSRWIHEFSSYCYLILFCIIIIIIIINRRSRLLKFYNSVMDVKEPLGTQVRPSLVSVLTNRDINR